VKGREMASNDFDKNEITPEMYEKLKKIVGRYVGYKMSHNPNLTIEDVINSSFEYILIKHKNGEEGTGYSAQQYLFYLVKELISKYPSKSEGDVILFAARNAVRSINRKEGFSKDSNEISKSLNQPVDDRVVENKVAPPDSSTELEKIMEKLFGIELYLKIKRFENEKYAFFFQSYSKTGKDLLTKHLKEVIRDDMERQVPGAVFYSGPQSQKRSRSFQKEEFNEIRKREISAESSGITSDIVGLVKTEPFGSFYSELLLQLKYSCEKIEAVLNETGPGELVRKEISAEDLKRKPSTEYILKHFKSLDDLREQIVGLNEPEKIKVQKFFLNHVFGFKLYEIGLIYGVSEGAISQAMKDVSPKKEKENKDEGSAEESDH
jgi:hypothetical protein